MGSCSVKTGRSVQLCNSLLCVGLMGRCTVFVDIVFYMVCMVWCCPTLHFVIVFAKYAVYMCRDFDEEHSEGLH